jgi:hypothetical protein
MPCIICPRDKMLPISEAEAAPAKLITYEPEDSQSRTALSDSIHANVDGDAQPAKDYFTQPR